MANEFIVRNGLIALADSRISGSIEVTGTITGSGAGLTNIPSSGLNAPGSDTQILFNSDGSLAANSGLVYSGSRLGVGIVSPSKTLHVGGTFQASGEAFFSHFDVLTNNSRLRDDLYLNFGTDRIFRIGYDSSIDKLQINSGSSAIMTFDASKNVGIGTQSPSAKLHVSGTSDVLLIEGSGSTIFDVQGSQGQLFSVTDSLVGSLFSVNDISGLPIIEVFDTDKVVMGTFGQNTLVVSGSRVGIGTDAPNEVLHLHNTVSGDTPRIHFTNGGTGAGATDGVYTGLANGDDFAIINYESGGHIYMYTAGNERLRIASDGKVGIGSNNPTDTLTINQKADSNGIRINGYDDKANSYALLYVDSGGNTRLTQVNSGSSGYLQISAENYLSLDAPSLVYTTSNFRIYDAGQLSIGSSGDYKFKYDNVNDILNIHTDDNKGLTLDNTGRLGIGTTSPTQALTVEGNISASGDIYVGDDLFVGSAGNGAIQVGSIGFLDGTSTSIFNMYSPGDIYLNADSNNNGNSRIYLKESGNTILTAGYDGVRVYDNLTVDGIVTAQEFHTEFVSASILYSSGSTKFGNTVDDVHDFTGRLYIDVSGSDAVGQTSALLINSTNNDASIRLGQSTNYGFEIKYKGTNGGNNNDLEFLSDSQVFTPQGGTKWMNVNQDGAMGIGVNKPLFIPGSGSAYNGNVGIGTISPLAPLDVNGNIYSSGNLLVNTIFARGGSSNLNLDGRPGYGVNVRSGSTSITYFDYDTARVGIGTTTPSQALDVRGEIMISSSLNSGMLRLGTTSHLIQTTTGQDLLIKQGFSSDRSLILDSIGDIEFIGDSNGNDPMTKKIFTVLHSTGSNELMSIKKNGETIFSGAVTASAFSGDGSGLTNVSAVTTLAQVLGNGNDGANNDIVNLGVLNSTGVSATGTISGSIIRSATSASFGGPVGIGTDSPSSFLEVKSDNTSYAMKVAQHTGTGFAPASLYLEATQAGSRGQGIYHYNTVEDINWFSGVPYNVRSDKWIVSRRVNAAYDSSTAQDTYALLTISGSGNVGIGTSTPVKDLQIGSGTFSYASQRGIGIAATSNPGISIRDTDNNVEWDVEVGNSSAKMGMQSNHPLYLITNNTTKATITAAGNVGVGTAVPSERLEVRDGNIIVSGSTPRVMFDNPALSFQHDWFLRNNGGAGQMDYRFGGGTKIYFDNHSIRFGDYGAGTGTNASTQDPRIAKEGSGALAGGLQFFTDNTARMTISGSTGYVGIGTTSPGYKLDIALDSTSDRFNITQGGNLKLYVNGNGALVSYANLVSYGNSLSGGGGMFQYAGGTTGATVGHRFKHVTSVFSNSSGDQTMVEILPSIGQSGTAGYTGLKVNVTETTTGSGNKYLMDLQVGGTSKMSVSNNGDINGNRATFASTVTVADLTSTGNATVGGNLTVSGIVTAQEFHTEFVSASIIYQSGSTQFGDTLDDVHDFTGKVNLLGPISDLDPEDYNNVLTLSANTGNNPGERGAGLFFKQKWFSTSDALANVGGISGIKTGGNGSYGGGLAFFAQPKNGGDSVEVMRFIDNGNVGIGNTSPFTRLAVNNGVARTSTNKTYSTAFHTNDTDDYRAGLFTAITGGATSSDRTVHIDAGSYRISTGAYSNTGESLALQSLGGNVGIGTASPNEKLEIAGNIRLQNSGRVYLWQNNNNNYIDYANWIASTGNSQVIQNTGAGGITFKTLTTARMFISSSGNIGIATTDPRLPLHVDGDARITNLLLGDSGPTNTPTAALHIKASGTNARMRIEDSDNANKYYDFVVDEGRGLHINEEANTRFYIAEGGNVGINTTSPNHTLDVTGEVAATSFIETSARRFKENIQPISNALEIISNIDGITFNRIGEERREYGFIADEVQTVAPELVSYDDNGDVYGVHYARTVAILTEAVKELDNKVKAQDLFIKDLVARIEKLENK